MAILLCDAGGTHARFALSRDGKTMTAPQKVKAADFPTIGRAIEQFLHGQNILPEEIRSFRLALGGRNPWQITKEEIAITLPHTDFVELNDFEANAHGIAMAESDDFMLLNHPRGTYSKDGSSKIVAGIGTGLGLAYIFETPSGPLVRRTHGGHMLPATASETHRDLFDALHKNKKGPSASIYEDIVSGNGLFNLYRLLSERTHTHQEYRDANDLIDRGANDPLAQQAIKILHEMLGVFLHQAAAFGFAYGGIYLTGGIIDRLIGKGLFDMVAVEKFFHQDNAEIVQKDVSATPIYWVKDEFVALQGLLEISV